MIFCMGVSINFCNLNTMSCNCAKLPLLLERAGERRIKSTGYTPPHPTLSRWRGIVVLPECVNDFGNLGAKNEICNRTSKQFCDVSSTCPN